MCLYNNLGKPILRERKRGKDFLWRSTLPSLPDNALHRGGSDRVDTATKYNHING
jgi:hypothetical protein